MNCIYEYKIASSHKIIYQTNSVLGDLNMHATTTREQGIKTVIYTNNTIISMQLNTMLLLFYFFNVCPP